MQCDFFGNYDVVQRAVSLANHLLSDHSFYEEIARHPRFDNTTATSREVADAMKSCTSRLEVVLYKTRNPWSRVLGKENEWEPNRIYLNSRRLDRAVSEIAGTMVHEAVHAADAVSPLDFGHSGNRPNGNDDTAPYWIGNMAIWRINGSVGAIAAVDHAPEDEQVA